MGMHSAQDAGEPQLKLDLRFPADVNRIAGIVDQVVALVRELYGATDGEQEVALAVTEALANAIRHGCRGDAARNVECRVFTDPSGVTIIVCDPGPGFDPGSVANPLESAGLSADHGRGLYMIRQLMDEVQFERGGAEIRMKKRF